MRSLFVCHITIFLIIIACENPSENKSEKGEIILTGWSQPEGGPVYVGVKVSAGESSIESWSVTVKAICESREYTGSLSGGSVPANRYIRDSFSINTNGWPCTSVKITSHDIR